MQASLQEPGMGNLFCSFISRLHQSEVDVGGCGWVWVGVVVHACGSQSQCVHYDLCKCICLSLLCTVFVGPGNHSKGTDHPTVQSPETGTPSCDCHVTSDAL